MSSTLLTIFLVISLVANARGDFDRDEINNRFTLRIGNTGNCGDSIRFTRESFSLSARDIRIEGDECSGNGNLILSRNPGRNPSSAVAFLLAENDSGDFLAGRLSSSINCGGVTIPRGSQFIFLEPEDDFRVRWSNFFGGSSGIQSADQDDFFEFDEDTNYLIIGSNCLYSATNIGDVCFPASATAELSSGHVARMDELKTGDEVLVAPGTFSPIIGWTHRDASKQAAIYTRVATEGGLALTATEGHYVYADGKMMRIEEVRVGMMMRTGGGLERSVREVKRVSEKGLYNPQTIHGDIVVNGLVSSTYTKSVAPMAAHALLAPLRAGFKAVCRTATAEMSDGV